MNQPTNYVDLPDAERWPLFVEEYGLPSLRQWLRACWDGHVRSRSNGEGSTTVWSNGFDAPPYWSLGRAVDLTHWGLGVTLQNDVWGERQDLVVYLGPISFGVGRSKKP